MEGTWVFRKTNRFDWWISRLGPILIIALMFVRTTRASPLKIVAPSKIAGEEEVLEFFGNISKDCTSRNCDESLNKKHLLYVQKYMNLEANPCNDFYEYACGNWDKTEKYPGKDHMAVYAYFQHVDSIFEQWQQGDRNEVTPPRSLVEEKLFTYYKSRQTNTSGSTLFNEYLHYLQEEQKMWQWGQPNDWIITLGKMGRFGLTSHFIKYKISTYGINYDKFALWLSPQNSGDIFSMDENILAALAEYTKKDILELKQKLVEFEEELLEVLDGREAFDTGLSGFVNQFLKTLRNEESKYISTVKSVANLMFQTEYKVDWQLYLSTLLGRPVESEEEICITDLNAIKRLTAFLHRSDSETVQLYSMARFLEYIEDKVPIKTDGLISNSSIRMYNYLVVLINHFYDIKYYSKIRKQSDAVIKRIFDTLRNKFRLILKENSMKLLDFELGVLQKRIDNMRITIGNLPDNFSSSDYYKYADKLKLREGNFALNYLETLRVFKENTLYPVGRKNITDTYISDSYTDFKTAYYAVLKNKVVLPLYYLQWPQFSEKLWDILLYGDLASIIGHEILHGFDSVGLKLGTILSNPLYQENIDCLLNGTENLRERIADVSGVHLAIRAFREQITETKDNTRLFFIKYAQFFCESKTYLEEYISDTHDQSKQRVNYVVANMPEFAESFGCASGEQMNPKSRCHLW